MLIGLICLGSVVVLISLLRLTVLLEFRKMSNFTFSLGKIIIISSIELEVAIMAANAPSLKIIFMKIFGKQERSVGYTEKHTLTNMSKSRKMATPISTCRITGNCDPELAMRVETNTSGKSYGSSEEILRYDGDTGIFITSSVAIERHDARVSQSDAGSFRAAKLPNLRG
jgi:hypothetical protein